MVQNHNHYTTAKAMYSVVQERERNRGYVLLMTASKPETALYRAPTFYFLLVSHGGLVHVVLHYNGPPPRGVGKGGQLLPHFLRRGASPPLFFARDDNFLSTATLLYTSVYRTNGNI